MQIGGSSDEAQGQQIHLVPKAPSDRLAIVRTDHGHRQASVREIDAFAGPDLAADLDLGHDPRPMRLDHPHAKGAVGHEHSLSDSQILDDRRLGHGEGRGEPMTHASPRRRPPPLDEFALLHLDRMRTMPDPDPRTAQIAKHRDGSTEAIRHASHPLEMSKVIGEGAVTEVEANDADARFDDSSQLVVAVGRRTERRHDPRERPRLPRWGRHGGGRPPRHPDDPPVAGGASWEPNSITSR